MSAASPMAINAAPVIAALKGSLALPHTVRAMPKKEMGGKMAMPCALVTERRLSKSGTVKLVASKANKAMTDTKRIDSESLRKAAEGRSAVSSPARAKMKKKLKTLAERTAAA